MTRRGSGVQVPHGALIKSLESGGSRLFESRQFRDLRHAGQTGFVCRVKRETPVIPQRRMVAEVRSQSVIAASSSISVTSLPRSRFALLAELCDFELVGGCPVLLFWGWWRGCVGRLS